MKLIFFLLFSFSLLFSGVITTSSLECLNGQIPDLSSKVSAGAGSRNCGLGGVDCVPNYWYISGKANEKIYHDFWVHTDGLTYASSTINTYICIVPPEFVEFTCPDGGTSVEESCDRSCEDVGLVSYRDQDSIKMVVNGSDSSKNSITYDTKCFSPDTNCNTRLATCLSTCGSFENILTSECKEGDFFQCECKGDIEDKEIFEDIAPIKPPHEDDIATDETTVSNDTKSLKNDINNLNTSVKNLDSNNKLAFNKVNDNLENIKVDTKDNLKVNQKIDNKLKSLNDKVSDNSDILRNINNSLATNGTSNDSLLTGVNDTLVNMNSNLGEKLLNIDGSLDGIKDGVDDVQDSLDILTDKDGSLQSEIDSIISDGKSKDDSAINNANSAISDIQGEASSATSALTSKLNSIASGFTFSPPSGGGSTMVTFSAFGASKSIDFGEYVSPLSGVISSIVSISLMLLAVKIYFFGFLLMKKD